MVKNPPAKAGDARGSIQFLDQEDPLGEEMEPTPVFLPGVSHGQRSLAGCIQSMGLQESDMT